MRFHENHFTLFFRDKRRGKIEIAAYVFFFTSSIHRAPFVRHWKNKKHSDT